MPTLLLSPNDQMWVNKVIDIFNSHEPVVLPTETVYGLAAPVSSDVAVARIYEIKERPTFNPLIMHVKEEWDLSQWAEIGDVEKKLISLFWPGPLSLLLKKKGVSDLVTAGSKKVVLRAPAHPVFREVLDAWGAPLVAPSANSSTKLSATTAAGVLADLGEKIVAIVDGGTCEWGVESTIVEVVGDKVSILREGAISKEDLEKHGFSLSVSTKTESTPGSQLKHYTPSVPLYFFENEADWASSSSKSSLYLKVLSSDSSLSFEGRNIETLSQSNNYKEAASKLFEFLRTAQAQYTEIRVLKTQDVSLGRAINDRLLRASQR
ncbi:MAG: L-threonylcarbamoyladenylate synthase [Bdellovibrionota bacterium]